MASAWKRMLVVVAIVLAAVAGWLVLRGEPRVATAPAIGTRVDPPRANAVRPVHEPGSAKITERARVSRAERDAVHRRIVDALERRVEASDDERGEPTAPPASAAPGEAAARPPIRNRLGDDDGWGDALVQQLGDDFGPLADECIADVRERVPDVVGMVALDITIAADADIGGVVESATPSADNEIDDPEFLECMRESMLSTVLPAPPGSGRRDVVLSLRVDDP